MQTPLCCSWDLAILDFDQWLVSDGVGGFICHMTDKADIADGFIFAQSEQVGWMARGRFGAIAKGEALRFRLLQELPTLLDAVKIDVDDAAGKGGQQRSNTHIGHLPSCGFHKGSKKHPSIPMGVGCRVVLAHHRSDFGTLPGSRLPDGHRVSPSHHSLW